MIALGSLTTTARSSGLVLGIYVPRYYVCLVPWQIRGATLVRLEILMGLDEARGGVAGTGEAPFYYEPCALLNPNALGTPLLEGTTAAGYYSAAPRGSVLVSSSLVHFHPDFLPSPLPPSIISHPPTGPIVVHHQRLDCPTIPVWFSSHNTFA